MKRILMGIAIVLGMTGSAYAGFESWSVTVESDPFSGGKNVSVLYNRTLRSQVQVICKTSESGLKVVTIPGFASESKYSGLPAKTSFAIDGDIVVENVIGILGAYGDNLAGVDIKIDAEKSAKLLDRFIKASRQIAIKDGISAEPLLLKARGSTKAGNLLKQCLNSQTKNAPEPVADDDNSGEAKQKKIAEISSQIEELQKQLKELQKSE